MNFELRIGGVYANTVGRSVSRLVGRSVGWSVSWLVGRLVGRLVGQSVGRLVSQLVGRSVGQSVDAHVAVDHTSVGLAQARPNKARTAKHSLHHWTEGRCASAVSI